MTPGFWKGRRVLVTGHTGFKGAWLVLWLQSMGARVHGLALAPPAGGLFDAARVAVEPGDLADVRDRAGVERAFAAAAPEVVFHLAAQALVRESYANPVETYATNVMGTANVLDAARRSEGLRAIVVATSDKCYEDRDAGRGYRETDALGGADPYSSSKACAELVASAYRQSFLERGGVRLATVRAGNVIGGGDPSADRLVPDLVRTLRDGRRPELRNPGAVRPWQHVLDPLLGYLMLAERLAGPEGTRFAEAWNFGPSDAQARSVQWVATRFLELCGADSRWIPQGGEHPHETARLQVDASKARAHLGWRPRRDLDQALRDTADWYLHSRQGGDMREFTLGQLAAFASQPAATASA